MGKMIQWFKKPSISKKLIIAFLVVLILPTVALTISAFFTSKTELDKQIMGSAMSQVNAFDTLINENIGNKSDAVTLFSDSLKASNLEEKIEMRPLKNYSNLEKLMKKMYPQSMQALKRDCLCNIQFKRCQMATIQENVHGIKRH